MEKCENCGNYKAYYTQGYCRFEKEKCGFCKIHEKIMQNSHCCEHWRSNYYAKKIRQETTKNAFKELLPKLSALLQIAEENRD